jgi:hypothetical protein
MTADVISLRRARKAKDRSEKDRIAAANRAAFGRTRAEKSRQTAERGRQMRALDGNRRAEQGEDEPA